MDLGENEDENDFYGEFNDIVDQNIFGKNETNEDMHHNAYFEKINESEKNKPQTEFSKRPNPKNQMKYSLYHHNYLFLLHMNNHLLVLLR